jgi:hypothetical protein
VTVPKQTGSAGKASATVHDSLGRLAKKLQDTKSLTKGEIVFRLAGSGGGNFSLECSEKDVRVQESAAVGAERLPLIEVMGDAGTIQAILDGEKDARKEFVAGGVRVRGDLRYLSDLAMELGLLKEPL